MSGGGSGGGNTTVTNSNVPDWLQQPTQDMIARAASITGPDAQYQAYQGEQVAGFSPLQQQAFQGVANLQQPGQFGQAGNAYAGAQGVANAAATQGANYAPGQFQAAAYNPAMQGNVAQTSTQNFDANAAKQYMDPYQQGVTDIALNQAARTGQQQINALGGVAAQNGAFGGSRFGLEQAQQLRDLGTNMSNIQMQGSNAAYQNAQAQFNADQNRGLQSSEFNAAAQNTAGAANQGAANQASQFAGQNYMTAQQAAEQSRQFANDAGLRGASLAAQTDLTAGQGLQSLGMADQQAQLNQLNAQGQAGQQQQNLAQQYDTTGYNNFINARDFDRNNLQFLSGLLHGQNFSTNSNVTTPTPSAASQVGGIGLAGLGAYKMFGG